jgi:hypothetical protein
MPLPVVRFLPAAPAQHLRKSSHPRQTTADNQCHTAAPAAPCPAVLRKSRPNLPRRTSLAQSVPAGPPAPSPAPCCLSAGFAATDTRCGGPPQHVPPHRLAHQAQESAASASFQGTNNLIGQHRRGRQLAGHFHSSAPFNENTPQPAMEAREDCRGPLPRHSPASK